jgi:hypothetical protein
MIALRAAYSSRRNNQVRSLTTQNVPRSWEELGFAGQIVPDYCLQFDVANFIDTASEEHELDTGIAVDLATIFDARSILQTRADAELERREQEAASMMPGAVQLNVSGVTSWYQLG